MDFNEGDLISITKDDSNMADWATEFAYQEIVFEVISVDEHSYWCKNLTNGEEYGISFNHAIPANTGLLRQIKNESIKL